MESRLNITTELPDIDEDLLKALERIFPPICYEGHGRIEDHLLYAGKVQLVAELRAQYDQQVADAVLALDEDEDLG